MPNCSNATPAEDHAWVLVRLVFHEGRLGGEWVCEVCGVLLWTPRGLPRVVYWD